MRRLVLLASLLTTASAPACRSRAEPAPRASRESAAASDADFVPLPEREPIDPRKVALGRRLFDDVRLSGDGTVACVSCHRREQGFSNGVPRAALPTREPGEVNVPTLLNVRYNFRFNWDGRYETLESQLDAIIVKSSVMRSSWPSIVARLRLDPDVVRDVRAAYGDSDVSRETLTDALVAYVRSLTTPRAPFDRWLAGDTTALGDEAHAGYLLFKRYGCSSCHQGRNIGGNLLQRFGIMNDYFADRGNPAPADRGHARVTEDPEDEHVFRVPSLRNVELTPPYFHDGTAATLDDAVRVMGRYQLGRELDDVERRRLVAFLRTLTGELGPEHR